MTYFTAHRHKHHPENPSEKPRDNINLGDTNL